MSLRQQNKAKVRARILDAAEQLIAEKGAATTTTREIAGQAGISYQTLYNYFPSKTLMLYAIVEEEQASWSSAVEDAIKQYRGNLLEVLGEINRIGRTLMGGDKNELWREIGTAMFRQSFNASQYSALNQVAHERYYSLLSMAQGTGELRKNVDLHLLAHTLFCLNQYAYLTYFLSEQHDPDAFLQTLQDQLALVTRPYLSEEYSPEPRIEP